ATLHVANVTYDVNGTPSGTPAGVTLSGDTLTIDPTNSAFDHLAVGAQTTITVHYDVKDVNGATVAQTETITITGTNDAPVVTAAAPSLTPINEDATGNTGQTVASFLGASITDVDDGAVQGIAITGISGEHGHWEYST